jgi:hypothetical protein
VQLATGFRCTLRTNPNVSNTASFSQGSQTFGTLNDDAGSFPRVKQLIDNCPFGTVVLMYCGANGMSAPTTEYANFVLVTERFRAAGMRPIAMLEPYLGVSQTGSVYASERDTYNASVTAYCAANNVPLIDPRPLYHNGLGQSYDYMFINDGGYIHPNLRGAGLTGLEFAKAIVGLYKLPDFPVTFAALASAITPNAGFVSDLWNAGTRWFFGGINATVAKAMVARSDGQTGNWAQFTITDCNEGGSTSAGTVGRGEIYNTSSTMPANGTYRAICEIEIDDWDYEAAAGGKVNGRRLRLIGQSFGGTTSAASVGTDIGNNLYQPHTVGERQSPNPAFAGNKLALITQPFTISTANGNTGWNITIELFGNMVARVGNCGIVPA